MANVGLKVVHTAHKLLGTPTMEAISGLLNKTSGNWIPAWNPHLPLAAPPIPIDNKTPDLRTSNNKPRVVYFPTCCNRMMGLDPQDSSAADVVLHEKIKNFLKTKAGVEVAYPKSQRSC